LAQGETDGTFLAMVFTGTAQHVLAGQAGRANRSTEFPGREVGGKSQGWWLVGHAFLGVFCAGTSAIRAERTVCPPEVGLWESSRTLCKQPCGARRYASAAPGADTREKRFVHRPRGTARNRYCPAQTLAAQESAATHIHKPPPVILRSYYPRHHTSPWNKANLDLS